MDTGLIGMLVLTIGMLWLKIVLMWEGWRLLCRLNRYMDKILRDA